MFESAELGHSISKARYKREEPALREALLDAQYDVLDAANFSTSGKFDFGAGATWFEGDFNYDGVVDVLDALEAPEVT